MNALDAIDEFNQQAEMQGTPSPLLFPLGAVTNQPPVDTADPSKIIVNNKPQEPEPPPVVTQAPIASSPPPGGAGMGVSYAGPLNPGALDAQGRKIAATGQQALDYSKSAADAYGRANEARKDAAGQLGAVAQQRAQANMQAADDQLATHVAYQARLDELKKQEADAVKTASEDYNEHMLDAKYANMSRDERKSAQAIAADPNATPAQRASARAQLDKAQNIDPNQLFGESTGAKITAAIAMALGAYASSMGGGPNTAMQIIQGAIADNIDAQKQNFAKKRAEAADARGRVSETRAGFEDDRQEALKAYGLGLEATKIKLAKISAGLEGTEAGAKAQELQAQLEQESIKTKDAYVQAGLSNKMQAQAQQGNLMANSAQLRLQMSAKDDAVKAAAAEGSVPGLEGRATSTKSHGEATEMWGDGQAMKDQIRALREFVQGKGVTNSKGEKVTDGKGAGREVFGTDDAKRAKAMADTLRIDFGKNLLKLGVLSDADLEMLNNIIPEDPTAFNQGAVAEKLKNAETFVNTKMNRYLNARGLRIPEASR